MEERIVAPDPVAEPQAYQQALLDLLGGLDPLDVLRETPRRYRAATEGLTDEVLSRPPEPGEWSLEQLIAHLLLGEIVFSYRSRFTLAQPGGAYPGYDQDAWVNLPRPPFADMLAAFDALRSMNVHLIETVPKSEWNKESRHEERGSVSFGLSVRVIAGHDVAHLKQLDQTRAAVTLRDALSG
jgi:hypothetical protein